MLWAQQRDQSRHRMPIKAKCEISRPAPPLSFSTPLSHSRNNESLVEDAAPVDHIAVRHQCGEVPLQCRYIDEHHTYWYV